MATLYGPSDVISFRNADGHGHTFPADQRKIVPGFGNDSRSLPALDCPRCIVFCQKQGWSIHPQKVQKTADEQEFEVEANRTGGMAMQLAAQQMGLTLAQMVANGGKPVAERPIASVPVRRKRAPRAKVVA